MGIPLAGKILGVGNAAEEFDRGAYDLDRYKASRESLGATDERFKQMLAGLDRPAEAEALAQQQEFRGRQMGLADLLSAAAQGRGPSLVDPMLARAQEENLSQQLALQGSAAPGANVGLLQRQTQQNVAQAAQQLQREAMTQRVREIMEARNQYAGLLGQGRQQDLASGQLAAQGQASRAGLQQGLFQQALAREMGAAQMGQQGAQLQLAAKQQDEQMMGKLIEADAQLFASIMGMGKGGGGGG